MGRFKHGKRLDKNSYISLLPLIVMTDVLAAGLILCIFASFHHVIPVLQQRELRQSQTSMISTPEPTASVSPEAEAAPEVSAAPLTDWQKKFTGHFTRETVITENSYTSPTVSIHIDDVVVQEKGRDAHCYVADIYVASLDNFSTYVANNRMAFYSSQNVSEMCEATNALLAIGGDYLTNQNWGFLMRNGELYMAGQTGTDICVLYADGSMATFPSNGYLVDDVLADDPVQIWNFGPMLLDENGKPLELFNMNSIVSYVNPRAAIGYYEPGHYCFVVVDGRQTYSVGVTFPTLAALFEDLGCTCAYNMDGGGSALMMFNGELYTHPSDGGKRELGDIILIREAP